MSHPTIRSVISGPRCLALLLVALGGSAPVQSQSPTTALNAVVRVSGTNEYGPFNGSGFVIALDRGVATIVTASHVLENAQNLQVTFAADPIRSLPFTLSNVLKWETNNLDGLAVFVMRGDIPGGVRPLPLADAGLSPGESAFLIGYPQGAEGAPRTLTRSFSRRDRARYEFDGGVGEGISGGPVVAGGKVVGVITQTQGAYSYAVPITILREFLLGSPVSLPSGAPVSDPVSKAGPPPGMTDITLQYVEVPPVSQSGCQLQQLLVDIGGASANPASKPYTIQRVPLGQQDYQVKAQVLCSLYGGFVCVAQGRGTITVDKGRTYGLQLVELNLGGPCTFTVLEK